MWSGIKLDVKLGCVFRLFIFKLCIIRKFVSGFWVFYDVYNLEWFGFSFIWFWFKWEVCLLVGGVRGGKMVEGR